MGRIGFGLGVFLSAFLLFQVQPIITKATTPTFRRSQSRSSLRDESVKPR